MPTSKLKFLFYTDTETYKLRVLQILGHQSPFTNTFSKQPQIGYWFYPFKSQVSKVKKAYYNKLFVRKIKYYLFLQKIINTIKIKKKYCAYVESDSIHHFCMEWKK